MFQEPSQYTDSDHFFFQTTKNLSEVCNAPNDKSGVFKVIELRNGRVRLVYIGFTKKNDLFDEIVYGKSIQNTLRSNIWMTQMILDNTDALDIYWYVVETEADAEKEAEGMLIDFKRFNGKKPKWN